MPSDIFNNFADTESVGGVSTEPTPKEEEIQGDDFLELTESQKKIIRSMATSKELPYETILQSFEVFGAESYFMKMTNVEQRFKMIKQLVTNKLEKLAKLISKEVLLIGKNINYFSKQKHSLALGLMVTRDKKGNQILQTVTSWEPLGDKAYKTLLPTKNGYYYTASISESDKGVLRLQENSLFQSEIHPIDNDDQYEDMNDAEILAEILKMEIFDSINEAGLSETGAKGYAKPEDIKIVRAILTKPVGVFRNKDIPELYTLRFYGTDYEGEKLQVSITASKELKVYENTTQALLPCTIIGTVGEYDGTKQMNAFNIVFDE